VVKQQALEQTKPKQGEEVWLRGYFDCDDNGRYWVRVVCFYGLRINHAGACSVKVATQDVKGVP